MRLLQEIVKHVENETGINLRRKSGILNSKDHLKSKAFLAYYTIASDYRLAADKAETYVGMSATHSYNIRARIAMDDFTLEIIRTFGPKSKTRNIKWLQEENERLKERTVCLELFLSKVYPLLEVPANLTELYERYPQVGNTKKRQTISDLMKQEKLSA